jgi:hypothetical protein
MAAIGVLFKIAPQLTAIYDKNTKNSAELTVLPLARLQHPIIRSIHETY